MVYEDEIAKHGSSHSRLPCPERDAIEEQYRLAVIAYGDALDTIQLRPRVPKKSSGRESSEHGTCAMLRSKR
jgi:hypothetical protein